MNKLKCSACTQTHGGFHLCPGKPYLDERDIIKKPIEMTEERLRAIHQKNRERHEARWAQTADRDLKMLTAYQGGKSQGQIAEQFGLRRSQVQSILARLGGSSPQKR